MKKILGFLLVFVVGLGFGFLFFHHSSVPASEKLAGAQVQNDTFNFTGGFNAGSSNQLAVDGSGDITGVPSITATDFNSATVGMSSSSPAALGSAIAGHFVIAAGASTAGASTTTVTLNSTIIMSQELTTPIPGTTCNTNIASDTVVSTKVAGNGFTVTNTYAPSTNPQCMAYWIIN